MIHLDALLWSRFSPTRAATDTGTHRRRFLTYPSWSLKISLQDTALVQSWWWIERDVLSSCNVTHAGWWADPAASTTLQTTTKPHPVHYGHGTEKTILTPVHYLPPLQLKPVIKRADSRLWNEFIHRYHYLGYKSLPGAQLRYFVIAEQQILALLGFGASAWQCAPRDRYIGWNHDQRKKNLHLIVNNARFLILPWVQSKIWLPKSLHKQSRESLMTGNSAMHIVPFWWKLL